MTVDNGELQLAIRYPAASTDIKASVNADYRVRGDLRALDQVDGYTIDAWMENFQQDTSDVTAANAIVATDLGMTIDSTNSTDTSSE